MKRFPITFCRRLLILLLVVVTGVFIVRGFFRSFEDVVQATRNRENAATLSPECFASSSCNPGTVPFSFSSESQFASPVVCINDARLFEETKLVKGLNIAVLNENSQTVESVRYISLLDGDHDVIHHLSSIAAYRIVVVASYGDVASKLSAEGRRLLTLFGASSLLEDYGTGDSFFFVGQRGLTGSGGFERVAQP